jgi:hypothetical protein
MFGNLEVNTRPFSSEFACSETMRDHRSTLMEDQRSSTRFDNARPNIQVIRMGNSINYAMSNQYKLSRATDYGTWKFRMKNILMQEMF